MTVRRNPGAVIWGVAGVAAVALWLALIARAVFNFSSPDAIAIVAADAHYYLDVVTRIPRNAIDVFPAMLCLAAGFGLGDWIVTGALGLRCRSLAGRAAFALAIGMACATGAIVALGMAGFLNAPVVGTMLVLGLAATGARLFATRVQWTRAHVQARSGPHPLLTGVTVFLAALLAVHLYLALLGALTPEVQFDARIYHLAEAKRYADRGALYDLAASQGSPEAALPQYQETLYAAVVKLFGLHAAKVFSWFGLPLAVLAIFGFAIEFFGSARLGLLAATLFASTPIVAWSATTASNDLILAPLTVLSLYAVLRWAEHPVKRRWLVVAGVLCGFAFGIKPIALFATLPLAAFVCIFALARPRSRAAGQRLRDCALALALFVAGAVAAALPGAIRETAITGDPVYPLAAELTHGPFWSPALAQAERASIRAYDADTSWANLPRLPWAMTVDATRYRNVIGPLVLFVLPFVAVYAIVRRRPPAYRLLACFFVAWIALWFASGLVEARYAEAVLPVPVLLAAFLALPRRGRGGIANPTFRSAFLIALLAIAVMNVQLLVPFQRGAALVEVSGRIPFLWPYLYDGLPERTVQLVNVPAIEYANTHLNARTDKLFVATKDFEYNLYSDVDLYDGIAPLGVSLRDWTLFSPDAYRHLVDLHVTYLLIYEGRRAALEASPLFPELTEIARFRPEPISDGTPASGEILYRVNQPARIQTD